MRADENRVLVVGIDPGATAGAVALSIDADRPSDHVAWRWLGAVVLKHHSRKGATDVELHLDTAVELASWIAKQWIERLAFAGIDAVVLERPADISGGWKGNDAQRGGRVQGTKTAFGLGESYGMLAMATRWPDARVRRVYEYEVREWMPKAKTGKFTHTQKRESTLEQLALFAQSIIGQTPDADRRYLAQWSAKDLENVLMALGVLAYHLRR